MQTDTQVKHDVIDLSGNTLFKKDIAGGENIIDFSQYPNGTYLMTLVIGGKSVTYKVMKADYTDKVFWTNQGGFLLH